MDEESQDGLDSQPSKDRETWTRRIDFLFVTVGVGVGFGNVWRFPYICYRNGGGAFLIPYTITVLVLGVPMVILEGALGQFMSRGVIDAWKIVPLFQGVGYTMTVLLFLGLCYYSILFAWVWYYLFYSMTSVLPWSHCGNDWNTEYCRESTSANQMNVTTRLNLTVTGNRSFNEIQTLANNTLTDPATEFWERKMLSISPGLEYTGELKWDLTLCLLLAWLVIYFCIWKGVKLTGLISYFTTTTPYVFLVALAIRGATLEGSAEGIKFYIFPEWGKMANPRVWLEACIQVFYSYAVGFSIHTSLGSCNVFHHNIFRHIMIFAIVNSGTSFVCGFVIFSVLGFMANKQGVSIDQVAESGPGLAFIAYPEAISQMPVAPLWAILFFLMLVFIAIDSEFVQAECFVVSILDRFPPKFRKSPRKEIITAICCVVWFLIGLSMVTEGGIYVQQLFEWYLGGRILFMVVFLECVVLAYFYGVNRFQRNVEYMIGHRIGPFFKYIWLLAIPAICLVLLITDTIFYPTLTYQRPSGVYHYPLWSSAIGWILASAVLCIPGVMIYRMYNTPGTMLERLRYLLKPEFDEVQRERDEGRFDPEREMTPELKEVSS